METILFAIMLKQAWIDSTTITLSVPVVRSYATGSDKITRDGHYIWTFDDPNNEYRCDAAGFTTFDGAGVTNVTVACIKQRVVDKEK